MMTPCLVVFMGMDAGGTTLATHLGEAFCREMLGLTEVEEAGPGGPVEMPCSGNIRCTAACHAFGEIDCRKLLVLIGADAPPASGRTLVDLPAEAQLWITDMAAGDDRWDVLPVLRDPALVSRMLPAELQAKNVAFFGVPAIEDNVLPAVFQRAGLAPEDYRIFISYLRRETTELAEQLHDALTREGFSVFVDRFSVPKGVNFQERLMQELADRGMVLLLHSAGLGTSHWVEEEIATATKYRMGLYILRLPKIEARPDLAPDRSRPIEDVEWDFGRHELTPAGLAAVVGEIKRVHREAHQRQLQRLKNALVAAFYDPARADHACTLREEAGGLFVITRRDGRKTREIPIHLTARPPELKDFYHTHVAGRVSVHGSGGIIAPAPFVVAQRRAWFDWLGRETKIRHVDEGQLRNAVDQIISGTF